MQDRSLEKTRIEKYAEDNHAELSPVTKYNIYNEASYLIQGQATNYPELVQFSPLGSKGLTLISVRNTKFIPLMNILIEDNVQLTSLFSGYSYICDEGAKLLCDFIKITSSLKVLDIHCSRMQHMGMMALIEALKINTSLTHINICSNAFSPEIFNNLMELFDKYNFSVRSICIIERVSFPGDYWKPTVKEEMVLHDLIIRNALPEKKTARRVVCGIVNEPRILVPEDIKFMLAKYSMFSQFPGMKEQRANDLLKNAINDYQAKF